MPGHLGWVGLTLPDRQRMNSGPWQGPEFERKLGELRRRGRGGAGAGTVFQCCSVSVFQCFSVPCSVFRVPCSVFQCFSVSVLHTPPRGGLAVRPWPRSLIVSQGGRREAGVPGLFREARLWHSGGKRAGILAGRPWSWSPGSRSRATRTPRLRSRAPRASATSTMW